MKFGGNLMVWSWTQCKHSCFSCLMRCPRDSLSFRGAVEVLKSSAAARESNSRLVAWKKRLVDPVVMGDATFDDVCPSYKKFLPQPTRATSLFASQPAKVEGTGVRRWEINIRKELYKEGEVSEVVEALKVLVRKGSYVSDSLFYRVLKRCIAERNLVLGRSVHSLAVASGYESNTFLANHLVRMYASYGELQEATNVFNNVTAPDTFMWFSIISAHTEQGEPTKAINLYQQMRQTNVKPNSFVAVAVLKACATAQDLRSGKQVHADIIGSEVEHDMFVGSSLVDMYAKCGNLEDAQNIFDGLPRRDAVTWNALIAGYTQYGLCQEALTLFADMEEPNHSTFVILLKACGSIGALHHGKQLHSQIQERGLQANVVVSSCLVDMYSRCGSLEDARKVFDNSPSKNVVAWTAMISGYANHGCSNEALALYAEMQEEGVTLANSVTFACLLKACASVADLHQGKLLHDQIRDRGLESDVVVGTCLVDMYAKCGSLEEARCLFEKLPTRNVVAWTALIWGYAQHGYAKEALMLYANMQQEGLILANQTTFACLLKACASIGALQLGKQLHSQILEQGMKADSVLNNRLVDMYAKCGSLEDARKVFDNLPTKDVVSWTTMINAYRQCSNGQKALQCFNEMNQHNVEPNEATFVCLLVACSHEGMVDDGKHHFDKMIRDYGIVPSSQHYVCMVDLLGRSGSLDEAEMLLMNPPMKSSAVGWMALLNACKSHGDAERGRRCFKRLTELEPQNAAVYTLLSGIYADAGKWRECNEIENFRKAAGACKKPASAWIEVKSKVHEFVVGQERGDISLKLKSVNARFNKECGQVPLEAVELKAAAADSLRENALCGHAEKLALAYGLLNTPAGTPLLVTKNLRMCNDCHVGTKLMSRVEKRQIIVRDAHRVHCFVDGNCSCGDKL